MKTKLTVTVDERVVPRAKQEARRRGISLSQVIEGALREFSSSSNELSFAARWRGKFHPVDREDDRYRRLAKKHL